MLVDLVLVRVIQDLDLLDLLLIYVSHNNLAAGSENEHSVNQGIISTFLQHGTRKLLSSTFLSGTFLPELQELQTRNFLPEHSFRTFLPELIHQQQRSRR